MASTIGRVLFNTIVCICLILIATGKPTEAGRYGTSIRTRFSVAINKSVAINDSTFTTVLAANRYRMFASICSLNKEEVIIGLCEANGGVGGIIVYDGMPWHMPVLSIYTGEICAKSVSGNQTIMVIEY